MGNTRVEIMGIKQNLTMDEVGHIDLLEAEKYVDDICQEVQKKTQHTDTVRILTIAALTITNELIKLKNLQENNVGNYEKKLNRLIKEIEVINSISSAI